MPVIIRGSLGIEANSTTGGILIPSGTTDQRPANTSSGTLRWNITTGQAEMWNGSAWQYIAGNYSVNYLLVAGGGGGGSRDGGGGGAGGYLTNTTSLIPGTAYTITVGAGGTGGSRAVNGTNGANSSGLTFTATGGGVGGSAVATNSGASGGSGGGGSNGGGSGAGTVGQGNAGGSSTGNGYGAGGGGASAVGANSGASAGNASFSGTVSTLNLASSGTGTFNNFSATGPSSFSGDVTVSAVLTSQDEFQNGPTGFFTDKNTKSASGTSPFATVASGGGGITGTYTTPYQVTGTESVIYANCSYVSGAPGDSSNATGFFIQASSASGGATSGIPAGFKLTIINTGATGGKIGTGITGPATGTYYYTGFSTTNGSYSGTGIVLPSGYPYKSALTLMWEPRIGGGSATQKGSWVVLSSSNITSY